MILYLISGRGFVKSKQGRKISEVIRSFKNVTETDVIFGGDVPVEKESSNTAGASAYYEKWYRKNKFVLFFSESCSELRSLWHNIQTYLYIARTNKRYELIWERSSGLHWAGILYAKRHGTPSVLEWKDHLIKDYPSFFKPLSKWVERWKVNNATFITVESQVLKDMLVSEGVPEKKIHVTYNAVNPEEFVKDENAAARIRKSIGVPEDCILVGYVGSYAFYHDSIRMIKAAEILKSKGVRNIKWLLIGDGKDKKACEEYAREHGLLNEDVYMLPFQQKELIPDYLSAMDVTILPGSTDIICPIKVMEYMAAKSVVLVPDYACNREVIDGRNGLLFTPFDENSIVEQLMKLSENPSLMAELGEKARKTVCETLTWDKTYGRVLKEILNRIQ